MKIYRALDCSQIFILHRLKYVTLHVKFHTNFWVISVRPLSACLMFSTWLNKWILFGLLMLHFNTLTVAHMGSLGNLRALLGNIYFIWFELQTGISLVQSTPLWTFFINCRVYVKKKYCCFNYCIFFLNCKAKLYLIYFYLEMNRMSCYHTGICPFSTCKNTPLTLILSFKHHSNSNAMCKIIFCLAEGFNFYLI